MINTKMIITGVKLTTIIGIMFYYFFSPPYISNAYNKVLIYINPEKELQTIKIENTLNPIRKYEGDKYSFYKELKSIEVKPNLEHYKVSKTHPYRLWCGSFRELSRAENLRKRLKKFSSSKITLKGEWHVVMTEDYPNKRSAEAKKWEIRKILKIQTCNLHRVKK